MVSVGEADSSGLSAVELGAQAILFSRRCRLNRSPTTRIGQVQGVSFGNISVVCDGRGCSINCGTCSVDRAESYGSGRTNAYILNGHRNINGGRIGCLDYRGPKSQCQKTNYSSNEKRDVFFHSVSPPLENFRFSLLLSYRRITHGLYSNAALLLILLCRYRQSGGMLVIGRGAGRGLNTKPEAHATLGRHIGSNGEVGIVSRNISPGSGFAGG